MQLIGQIIELANLQAAWGAVSANKGAPGADGVSLSLWERDLERHLYDLQEEVLSNRYRPQKLRRFSIPKADGNLRHFGIPSVRDRVLQRAALNVLDPIFEPRFLPVSFGYRPGVGVQDAVARIVDLREEGYLWLLDGDIDECFPSIDHELLMGFLKEAIDDDLALGLIRRWLDGMRGQDKAARGLGLGAVISPLLCNIYLHRLDSFLGSQGFEAVVRYADDFCVFCTDPLESARAQEQARVGLSLLKMVLEPNKTRLSSFEQGFNYLGVHFEGDEYSYLSAQKRIRVKGAPGPMPPGWLPEGYESWERST